MTAAEIAETLLNGNIAQARQAILNGNDAYEGNSEYAAAVTALDVVAALFPLINGTEPAEDEPWGEFMRAHWKVRRCLEGAP